MIMMMMMVKDQCSGWLNFLWKPKKEKKKKVMSASQIKEDECFSKLISREKYQQPIVPPGL